MVTFLSGGTGTPKLLAGTDAVYDPEATTVIANTGDDVELGGLVICPDLDTVLFVRGGILDRETWWGIADDTLETHDFLATLVASVGLDGGPRYLSDDRQMSGRPIARWRRFSGAGEFMTIGDRDRAVHLLRTGLLDEGVDLTAVTERLCRAFDLEIALLPMSDEPVATMLHTADGPMHFQEYWVHHRGEPTVTAVEYRGADEAAMTEPVREALADRVVIGPANPVTSIGPMLAIDGIEAALRETPVVVVSPFVGREVFSGPAGTLMDGIGMEPSTGGVAATYAFADAFVLDSADGTTLDRPVVRTDTRIDGPADAARVASATRTAFAEVT